jgi:4-hydroxy-tetrahydrodipicolinate reductase
VSGDRAKLVLCGATGRTGNAVAQALASRDDIELVALVAPSVATTPTRPLPDGVPAFATLEAALRDSAPDTLLDLTHAEPALEHLQLALDHGLHAVVGATGFADGALDALGERFAAAERGLLLVPNFSIGSVLATRMAYGLATYFPDAEIVEVHHDGKRDSPSGTAIRTAQMIALARRRSELVPTVSDVDPAAAGESPARGESVEGVPVHALRLPGATAHQEVVFGSPGELVTIRHDAIDRSCYAAGVVIASRRVRDIHGLEIGLEHAL